MYNVEGKKKGLRCQICTGCGLCPGVFSSKQRIQAVSWADRKDSQEQGALHVLAEDALLGERMPLGGRGLRLAVADIGTTTIAMLLYREDGTVEDRYAAVNPQSMYGADVLSRIRAAQDRGSAADMQRQVMGVLEKGLARFKKHLQATEELQVVLAGNTTMIYLLTGRDPEELGYAPFSASHLSAEEIQLADIPCFVFPGLSAFVGGDIAAGIHACRMAEQKDIVLLVDLGTNGEMVLGNCDRRIACATAAGPAFEGGVNRGIWGADLVSLLAGLLEEGILDSTGLLAQEYFEAGVRIGNVLVTQEAVRSVQLAKAAIAAGIEILMEKYGITAEGIDRVVLAGGFGYYLSPDAAVKIGLLPEGLAEKAVAGGNTVLSGAVLAGRQLFASGKDFLATYLEKIAKDTEIINLAMEAGFEEKYVRNMNFSCIHFDRRIPEG